MLVTDAQRQVRSIYLGGSVGQAVSAVVWLASAAGTTWASPRVGALMLIVGGMCIFPLTQLVLRAQGRVASLPPDNALRELAIEIAFLIPLLFPLVGAATLFRAAWFYPAMMIVVGAHYLPFAFLYGMRQYMALAALLVGAGLLIGVYEPGMAIWGAWLTSAVLGGFALVSRSVVSVAASQAS